MNNFGEKLKEVLYSVLPITLIVLFLHFTIAPLEKTVLFQFLIGSVFIIIGLAVFLIGVDIGIAPIGNLLGSAMTKMNKVWIIGIGGFLLGFFIAVAEPDLLILATQVDAVTNGIIPKLAIVVVVSLGIGILLALGFIRIVFNFPLYKSFTILYGIILVLSFFSTPEFLAIAFDASGATTGALSVPFILALALGVSSMKKDSAASEQDSFGLVGMASAGVIISVLFMSVVTRTGEVTGAFETEMVQTQTVIQAFLKLVPSSSFEVFMALLPLTVIFLFFHIKVLRLNKKRFRKILKGLLYTFIGLVIFLMGAHAGFIRVGAIIGYKLATLETYSYIIIMAFILGAVTILAEPAVYVLTHQIEQVTSGYIKRRIVLIALSIGVGIAIMLSVIRIIVPQIQLWHYLLPGYIISVGLSHVVPELFVGIGYDSGGVASGPMAATFILAFAHGTADAVEGATVLIDGFGIIAMVALTPIIALQVLGFIFKMRSRKERLGTDA
ncbi:MAG: DUF1538 domain-containing protein [Firmicutes bacterium]|nr:DUF1538 domain-containing protein [Bacillota bacterium]